jgi:hypothetical protein
MSFSKNEYLVVVLESICNSTETETILTFYKKEYGSDLVSDLKELSDSYEKIKFHLSPLISRGSIEKNYPINESHNSI